MRFVGTNKPRPSGVTHLLAGKLHPSAWPGVCSLRGMTRWFALVLLCSLFVQAEPIAKIYALRPHARGGDQHEVAVKIEADPARGHAQVALAGLHGPMKVGGRSDLLPGGVTRVEADLPLTLRELGLRVKRDPAAAQAGDADQPGDGPAQRLLDEKPPQSTVESAHDFSARPWPPCWSRDSNR